MKGTRTITAYADSNDYLFGPEKNQTVKPKKKRKMSMVKSMKTITARYADGMIIHWALKNKSSHKTKMKPTKMEQVLNPEH